MTPFSIARKGKGLRGLINRSRTIARRYGMTPVKMDRILRHFTGILQEYNCGATFPITCAALGRNRGIVEKYIDRNIEYAVHGFVHVDYSTLDYQRHLEDMEKARQIFSKAGLVSTGFRSPYLRANAHTIRAVKEAGFLYDSSLSVAWRDLPVEETPLYRTALGFYGTSDAADRLAMPHLERGLVRIPYCLPDDESLVERLAFPSDLAFRRPWLEMLRATHRTGELFTLGLHPERIFECEGPLRETLRTARSLQPHVWIARLDEIARWWAARSAAEVKLAKEEGGVFRLRVDGPEGVRFLIRGGETLSPTVRWEGPDRLSDGQEVVLRAENHPLIGISPESAPAVSDFLRQQGFLIVETANSNGYTHYINRKEFGTKDHRSLLSEIDATGGPLVRLARWPDGAKSALSVTGDIDALTLWDYASRFVGK